MPNSASRQRVEQGAAAVEFALVLPILLAVVFGIITYGFIFASQIGLNSGARDAARAGVVKPVSGNGMTCSAIATMARQSSTLLGGSNSAVGVTVTYGSTSCSLPAGSSTVSGAATATLCTGSLGSTAPLTVALTYHAHSPVPIVPGTDATLSANGEFQCEYS